MLTGAPLLLLNISLNGLTSVASLVSNIIKIHNTNLTINFLYHIQTMKNDIPLQSLLLSII